MKKNLIQIIISAILFVIGLLVPFSNGWITKGIYIGAYLIVGLEIIIKAIKNIFKGEIKYHGAIHRRTFAYL